ncbi:hypothetical protein KF913_14165 [Candidatus Obscuribacterales bacterium]|nr:hypothetical protein [Candidatus Obscuribacterales bacterium]
MEDGISEIEFVFPLNECIPQLNYQIIVYIFRRRMKMSKGEDQIPVTWTVTY